MAHVFVAVLGGGRQAPLLSGVSTAHCLSLALDSGSYRMQGDLQAQLGLQALGNIVLRSRVRVGWCRGRRRVRCGCQARDIAQDGRLVVGVMWGQGKWPIRGRLNHTLRPDSSSFWGSCNPITARLPCSEWKPCLTRNRVGHRLEPGHLLGKETRGCTGSFVGPHRPLPAS